MLTWPASHHAEVFTLLGAGLRDGGWMGKAGRWLRARDPASLTHYNIFRSPLFAAAVLAFLGTQRTEPAPG